MQKQQWKQAAIQKSGVISDAWDVFISYAGRFAAWILFGCMISNIIEVVVSVPPAVISVIMVIQVITLDIAGFGLNTIAKNVAKHGDDEAKAIAHGAKRLGSFLIGLMILTLGLVTVGYLIPTIATYTDMTNKALILARVIMIVVYMHTMHELSEAATDIAEKATQQTQANDQLSLENAQRCTQLENDVHILVDKVEKLCTSQQSLVDMVHKNVDMTVDLTQFNQLAETVNVVNQTITHITNNLMYTPMSTPSSVCVHEVEEPQTAIAEASESHQESSDTNTVKPLPVPVLDVPGVSQQKVNEVIAAYLSGTGWRDMSGNYSRTIKPIRDAYEEYVHSNVDM